MNWFTNVFFSFLVLFCGMFSLAAANATIGVNFGGNSISVGSNGVSAQGSIGGINGSFNMGGGGGGGGLTPGKLGDNHQAKSLGIDTQDRGLVEVVRAWINVFLGLVFLICLIIVIWAGFLMMTANGDDGRFQKGFTIIKQMAIGMVVIALSYVIVAFIFSVIGSGLGK